MPQVIIEFGPARAKCDMAKIKCAQREKLFHLWEFLSVDSHPTTKKGGGGGWGAELESKTIR